MFPHEVKQTRSTRSHYVVSIYCICLMHIPGVQMVHCSVCMQQLVSVYELYETFSEKIAAHATETSFICEYCKKEGVHPICNRIFYVKIPAGRAHASEILPINCHYPIFYPSFTYKKQKGRFTHSKSFLFSKFLQIQIPGQYTMCYTKCNGG